MIIKEKGGGWWRDVRSRRDAISRFHELSYHPNGHSTQISRQNKAEDDLLLRLWTLSPSKRTTFCSASLSPQEPPHKRWKTINWIVFWAQKLLSLCLVILIFMVCRVLISERTSKVSHSSTVSSHDVPLRNPLFLIEKVHFLFQLLNTLPPPKGIQTTFSKREYELRRLNLIYDFQNNFSASGNRVCSQFQRI